MDCRACQSKDTRIIDSRPLHGGDIRRRLYHCEQCGNRWSTGEVYVAGQRDDGKVFDDLNSARGWRVMADALLESISTVELSQILADRVKAELGYPE